MASRQQPIIFNFGQGLDLKTDPYQVQIGKFLSLQNTIFTKAGLLQKRNGYQKLTTLPSSSYSYSTTLNGNLTAIGPSIAALSSGTQTWVSKGSIAPMNVATLPLIRSNINQTQCDSVVAANGLVCTVYSEVNAGVTDYRYVIADSITGQNVVSPTAIPIGSGAVTGSPRIFLLGSYFVIVFTNVITATSHLQYVAISTLIPTVVTANTDIASSYSPAATVDWDGVVANNQLFVAYNTTVGGQSIKVTYLNSNLSLAAAVSFTAATDIATEVSLCADTTASVIYVSFYNLPTTTCKTLAVNYSLQTILSPTTLFSTGTILNIASAAQNGVMTLFYEVSNAYSYDSTVPSNYVNGITCSQAGSVGTPYVVARSVGLASKAFIVNGTLYFLASFQSPYQPTYFLINGSTSTASATVVVAKIAYENGGGYLTVGLPSVTVKGTTAYVPYLYKDLIEALATSSASTQTTTGGIYSQTGINLASFNIESTTGIVTSEIAGDLHISGGFLWMYDGYLPVEHNFFLWPDSVEATWLASSVVTPTGTFTSGSTTVTLSSATGVSVGMTITDTAHSTYIPTGTLITALSGTTATISKATTNAGTSDALSIQGNIAAQPDGSTNTSAYYYQALYEWSDNTGNIYRSAPSIPVAVTTTGSASTGSITVNIPYLRLTYKTANPVKIVLYRWSVKNQNYYQVTSITSPVLNSTTSDSVAFVDVTPDSASTSVPAGIVGNSLIYTTGSVVEDVNAPATNIMTLFDDRLWLVDAEDPNLLWFSKQVIETTPVEMSDLLTMYIAPTLGSQGSTGQITALSAMDDKLIIFKPNAIYYINGQGPDNTGANSQYSQPIFITSTVGCSNPSSIVFTPQGLMFQSDKGIWLLGRDLSTQYIGAHVETLANNALVQSSVNVPGTNQVRFTLNTGISLMYDYFFGNWGTFVGVPAISSTLYQGLHTFINSSGQVYQENPGRYLDGSNPVLVSFLSAWIDMAGISGYERLLELQLLGSYVSPHLLDVKLGFDFGPLSEQAIIQPTNFSGAYGSDALYGQGSPYGGQWSLEQWRIQNQTQKCQSFQISLQEVYDPSYGNQFGAGFTLSAITSTVLINRTYRPVKAAATAGTM